MAVFLLLTVLVLQIVSQAARSTDSGNRSLESTKSARISLDTLAEDLSNAVTSNGATIIAGVDGNGLTTSLTFLCTSRPDSIAPAGDASHRFAGVYFGMDTRDNVPMLCRGFESVDWDKNLRSVLSAFYNSASVNSGPDRLDSLGESVFRLAVGYLKTDNTIVYSVASGGLEDTQFESTPSLVTTGVPLDLTKIKGIIVAVASLDKKTQKLLLSTDPTGLSVLASKFPSPLEGKTPLDTWSAVTPSSFTPILQNIKYFQRTIYIQ